MRKYIEIRIGGGPEASNGQYWANLSVVGGKPSEFSSKPHKEQLDSIFSKNKVLLIEKAKEEAESIALLYQIETLEIVDESDNSDNLSQTLTVESSHRGAI